MIIKYTKINKINLNNKILEICNKENFNYTNETATTITESIHAQGSAVVAVLPYEIAEQRGIEITIDARSQGYPLQVKVEAERN
jgi:ATP-dependent Clp protease adapter protein ClpS